MERQMACWSAMQRVAWQLWQLTMPRVRRAATQENIPMSLYDFSDLGLETFSVANFQRRDPFTNSQRFLAMFADLSAKGWIEPIGEQVYHVTPTARAQVAYLVSIADSYLATLITLSNSELEHLLYLLRQIDEANRNAGEPPEKWAILNRFRVANQQSPLLGQIREYVMDIYAYRDDAHLAAWQSHQVAGYIWNAFSQIWQEKTTSPNQIAEALQSRGYAVDVYRTATQKLCQLGWVEPTETVDNYCVTKVGRRLRDAVEEQTDEYFYRPWSHFNTNDLDTLYHLIANLSTQLSQTIQD